MFIINDNKGISENCGFCREEKQITKTLKVCNECLKNQPEKTEILILEAHKRARDKYSLPHTPPRSGLQSCNLCNHKCEIGDKERSFCGLRYNKEDKNINMSSSNVGVLDYYLDPLPCNCCAAWFCPARTGAGYPEFATRKGREIGYHNLSIFFYGCSFNCLFCQNKNHKNVNIGSKVSISKLTDVYKNNNSISCVCFFGGSPEPQFPFALSLSKRILNIAKKEKRIARICWEWNGNGIQKFVKKAAELSLISGGNIKFDLKAWNSNIHKALTGVDNKKVLENFKYVGIEFFNQRPELPVLNATTLLVPGYVDEDEVENIAAFIASIDENIPYSLLGFYPHFEFTDLPLTSLQHAENCYKVASAHLTNVNIGNKHLLR